MCEYPLVYTLYVISPSSRCSFWHLTICTSPLSSVCCSPCMIANATAECVSAPCCKIKVEVIEKGKKLWDIFWIEMTWTSLIPGFHKIAAFSLEKKLDLSTVVHNMCFKNYIISIISFYYCLFTIQTLHIKCVFLVSGNTCSCKFFPWYYFILCQIIIYDLDHVIMNQNVRLVLIFMIRLFVQIS